LCVGFLGGLTTFSSFSYESLTLLSEGNLAGAGLNIIGSVVVGVVCAWFGAMAARSL
jgi:CrcB protein